MKDDIKSKKALAGFERLVLIGVIISIIAIILCIISLFMPSSQKSIDPISADYTSYFVSTNDIYTERCQGDLAQMAISLNYFDFDRLIEELYPEGKDQIVCTPIEAMDGSTTYDYSFSTNNWCVELFTLIDNEACTVTSWIDIYSLSGSECYEYQALPAKLKPSNYVTNLHQHDSSTSLFIMERKAFADFIVLVRSGGLNQGVAIPFDMAGLNYQKISTAPDPAS